MAATRGSSALDEATCERLEQDVTTIADRDPLAVRAPATGEVLGSVPACQPDDVATAVDRARTAQSEWADRPIAERAETLHRFADLVRATRSELLDIVQLEAGKARFDALTEVLDVILTADYYARRGPTHLAPSGRDAVIPLLTRAVEHRDPVGVVGLIEPWNYPLTLAVSDMLPALLAGNGAVLKPAEATPFCALRARELLVEAGVPGGLVQVVTGDGAQLGEPLVSGVDYVTFTGSTATGRTVASLAGEHLVDASLELGGKNGAVVLPDADLGAAVRGLGHGSFANAGQLCIAIERIYVHEAVYEAFRERFVAATEALDLGCALDFGPDVGSLVGSDQLATVERHVADARERGATVETGGRHRPDIGPSFYEPTVLTDLPADATAACEETFGPVVSLTPVESVDAAVDRINDTDYGLHASVWTGDADRGEDVARELDTGTVCINDAYTTAWAATDAPMGGVGDSGIGRRHGAEGILKYTEAQTVATARSHPLVPIPGVPDWLTAAATTQGIRALRRLRRLSPFGRR